MRPEHNHPNSFISIRSLNNSCFPFLTPPYTHESPPNTRPLVALSNQQMQLSSSAMVRPRSMYMTSNLHTGLGITDNNAGTLCAGPLQHLIKILSNNTSPQGSEAAAVNFLSGKINLGEIGLVEATHHDSTPTDPDCDSEMPESDDERLMLMRTRRQTTMNLLQKTSKIMVLPKNTLISM